MSEPDPKDPWAAPTSTSTSRVDPAHPLPRLDELFVGALAGVAKLLGRDKAEVDKAATEALHRIRQAAVPWDAQKAADIRARFKPNEPSDGMGCMAACYDVLGILYGPQVGGDIRREVYKQALDQAKAYAAAHPGVLNDNIEKVKAAATAEGKTLTDQQARNLALEQMTSPFNSADHLFRLMEQRGLAGEPAVLQF